MAREDTAREGAQAVIPDDEVVDVAVVRPRGSTLAGILGGAAGGALGNSVGWGVAGMILAERANSATKGSYPSIVLALSATRLYVLGRDRDGLVGGWKHLHPLAQIERADLAVERHRHGTVGVISLTDTTTDSTLEFEVLNVGNLGLDELLASLQKDQ